MKLFVVLALVAAAFAEPEADPYLTYGGLWGAGYGGYLGHHLTGYGYGYAPSVYGGYHAIGKREAEAEPEADADAALYYSGLGLGYAGLYGGYRGHHLTGYGFPYTRSVWGGYHAIGKREAEAEPKADADAALYYSGLGYTGLGYTGLGYTGLGYTGLGYTGFPYTRSVFGGYHAIGKREAEAAPEADADALYYTGYTGLHGLGYYPYAARTYAGLHGYGARFVYGK